MSTDEPTCPPNDYYCSTRVSNLQCKLIKKGRKSTTALFLETNSYLFKLSKVCDFKEALYRVVNHLLVPFKFIKRQRGGKSLYIAVPARRRTQIRAAATLTLQVPHRRCNVYTRLPVRLSFELGTLESFSQEVCKHEYLAQTAESRTAAILMQRRLLWRAGLKKNRAMHPKKFQRINLEYAEMLTDYRTFLYQAALLAERVYAHPAPALVAIKAAFCRASDTIANRGIVRRELLRKKF